VSTFAALRAGKWLRGLTIGLVEDGLLGLNDDIRVEWNGSRTLVRSRFIPWICVHVRVGNAGVAASE
jgi:hypothetical protein